MGKCFSSHSPRECGDVGGRRTPADKRRTAAGADADAGGGGDGDGDGDSAPTDSLEQLFRRYRDPDGADIRDAGVSSLCSDLGLDPVDIRVLLLAWLCDAKEMCCFSREQFCRGCRRLRACTAPQLRAGLDRRLSSLLADADEAAFRDLYAWTFDFGLEADQRTLRLAMAADLWGLVFSARPSGRPALLAAWLQWLRSGAGGAKVITRDTWLMFLTFCDSHGADLAAYDQNEAWPSLIDEFVEAETDRANQNLSS